MQQDEQQHVTAQHNQHHAGSVVNTVGVAVATPPVMPMMPASVGPVQGMLPGVPSPYHSVPAMATCQVPGMAMNPMPMMPLNLPQQMVHQQHPHHMQNQPSLERGCQKKTRLVWTPELHKRFLFAVESIGLKVAVPRTILQVMGVEGLTRENIASHLQKYRRLLEKKAGLSGSGPVATQDWPKLEAAQRAHLAQVRKQMEEEGKARPGGAGGEKAGGGLELERAPVSQFAAQQTGQNGAPPAQQYAQPGMQQMMPFMPMMSAAMNDQHSVPLAQQAPGECPVVPQQPITVHVPTTQGIDGSVQGVPVQRAVMPPPMYVIPQGDGTPMLLPMLPAMYAAACGMNTPHHMGRVPLQPNMVPGMCGLPFAGQPTAAGHAVAQGAVGTAQPVQENVPPGVGAAGVAQGGGAAAEPALVSGMPLFPNGMQHGGQNDAVLRSGAVGGIGADVQRPQPQQRAAGGGLPPMPAFASFPPSSGGLGSRVDAKGGRAQPSTLPPLVAPAQGASGAALNWDAAAAPAGAAGPSVRAASVGAGMEHVPQQSGNLGQAVEGLTLRSGTLDVAMNSTPVDGAGVKAEDSNCVDNPGTALRAVKAEPEVDAYAVGGDCDYQQGYCKAESGGAGQGGSLTGRCSGTMDIDESDDRQRPSSADRRTTRSLAAATQ